MFCLKKVKALYIPFVLFNMVTLLLRNVFVDLNIYTNNDLFLEDSIFGRAKGSLTQKLSPDEMAQRVVNILKFTNETQLGGATWFLRVLFGTSILWCVLNYIMKKIWKQKDSIRMAVNIAVSVCLLILAWWWKKDNRHFVLQFQSIASAYIMFCTGYYMKGILKRIVNAKYWFIIVGIVMSFGGLYLCDKLCSSWGWDSNVNNVSNPVMYLVSSYAGFITVYGIAVLLQKLKYTSSSLCVIGRHTLSVVLFHFLCFKIVSVIQCVIYHQPMYRVASFPVFYSKNGWWLAYTIAGIGIPVVLGSVYKKAKNSLGSIVFNKK